MRATRSDSDAELEALTTELVEAIYRLAATVDRLAPRSPQTGAEAVVSTHFRKSAIPLDEQRDAETQLLKVLLDVKARVEAFAREFEIPLVEQPDLEITDRGK